MTLTRIWTPTGNYSGGGTKRILVIHTMEGFTGSNGALDCARYFQGNSGASSQVCIDNNRGTIWEGVRREHGAWTQCGYNSVAISCEQSGYASWSRDYWLSNRGNQLHNIADWLAEESRATGIPLVDISASAAQGSGTGVCYHSELGSAGCGHSDPGAGFPLDQVLAWALSSGSAPPPQGQGPVAGEDFMQFPGKPGKWLTYHEYQDKDGGLVGFGVGTDGEVYYITKTFSATSAWRGPNKVTAS